VVSAAAKVEQGAGTADAAVSQCDGVPDADEAEALEMFDIAGGELGEAVGAKAV
jgi:hypothetical protein